MSEAPASPYRVQPLNDSHDRTAFYCGVAELDNYLLHRAGQDARRKVAAPFVMVDRSGAIVGYYTLSAYSVYVRELPEAIVKKLPKYPQLPATLLGRLAISTEHRGENLGRLLLMDALYRSWKNTSEIASIGVVVEAIDDRARAFYERHEFRPLLEHANKRFLSMGTIERAFR